MLDNEHNKTINSDDVVDLRDLITMIITRKRLIFILTAVCIFVTVIINFFVFKPEYQATAVVAPASISSLTSPSSYSYIISNAEGKNIVDSSKMSYNMDQIVKLAQVDIDGYKEILTSNDILYKTIVSLGLDTTVSILKQDVIVNKSSGSVIEIKVKNKDPEISAKLTNTLINEANNKLAEINSAKMADLSKNLDEQLKVAQSDLNKAYETLKVNASQEESDLDKRIYNDEIRRKQDLVDSLSSKILELRITKSLSTAEDRIIVLSPAYPPEEPTSPQKMRNVAASVVLGFLFSVLAVSLFEYFKKCFYCCTKHVV